MKKHFETVDEYIISFPKETQGTIKFPINKPIPYDLVKKIVQFSLKENSERSKQNE